jgi:hypothetical protein
MPCPASRAILQHPPPAEEDRHGGLAYVQLLTALAGRSEKGTLRGYWSCVNEKP